MGVGLQVKQYIETIHQKSSKTFKFCSIYPRRIKGKIYCLVGFFGGKVEQIVGNWWGEKFYLAVVKSGQKWEMVVK